MSRQRSTRVYPPGAKVQHLESGTDVYTVRYSGHYSAEVVTDDGVEISFATVDLTSAN
jgi:hypothetical protein